MDNANVSNWLDGNTGIDEGVGMVDNSHGAPKPGSPVVPGNRGRAMARPKCDGQARLICASVVAEVNFMPATARVKEPPSEKLPLEERVRRRAYELYILRGNQSGSEYDDWLQAEDEIRRAQEHAIDEGSEESFPASDPPAY